ncbi:laccase [Trifolium repens]|nr:laccase [Trifolium repens]
MTRFMYSLAWPFVLLLASSLASAAIVEHTWNVEDIDFQLLCRPQVITAVNGTLPGPTINAREGDTVIIHVFNKSPYNLTIHWHGIIQFLTPWSDGPEYVTQCPIPSNGSYTYQFNLTGHEGTLWWHAHSSFLRSTVYGALIIKPRLGHTYPFPKVYQEIPVVLGEWWNANVEEVERNATDTGNPPEESNASTINGFPSDWYNCSQDKTYTVKVKRGKTYLLRVVNAALNTQHFFKIANHSLTVVAMDAIYTEHYNTDVLVLAPGQTVDVLLRTNQAVNSYYMVFTPYRSSNVSINNITTRGVIVYDGASTTKTPIMPILPDAFDTPKAHKFYTNVTGLTTSRHWVPVPRKVDEHMFITFGIGLEQCINPGPGRCVVLNSRLSANMNNESFVLPKGKKFSLLEAFYRNASIGIYTKDFPNKPAFEFDYTDPNLRFINATEPFAFAPKSTKLKPLKFNSTVQIVLQNTAILGTENHPIHIHGYNFHVLAQGFGNYNSTRDEPKFNFFNPQMRNTISVPVGGWAVIRFQANNPGIWFIHCHLETHLPWGLGTAFEVENGPTPETTIPPPPAIYPKC